MLEALLGGLNSANYSKYSEEPLTADDDSSVSSFTLFIIILLLALIVGHMLHAIKFEYATEGSVALVIGLLAGGGVLLYHQLDAKLQGGDDRSQKMSKLAHIMSFDPQIFFEVLLPPIIFNAGFSIKKKLFFQNFFTLLLFGIIGTFFVSGIIWAVLYFLLRHTGPLFAHLAASNPAVYMETAAALGTLFSATDSIAVLQILDQDTMPLLYSLVFGEGVVNDATSIVLLRAVLERKSQRDMQAQSAVVLMDVVQSFAYLFANSLVMGVAFGLLSALLIRYVFRKHATDREVFVVVAMSFLAYLVADGLGLSGIFAVFFCGITMSHYTWHSLSPSAKVITLYIFRIMAFVAETFLFLYCGFDMWGIKLWRDDAIKHMDQAQGDILRSAAILAAVLLLSVLAARASFVFPVTALVNTWRAQRIRWREAVIIWWGGTFRGAITIALIYSHFNDTDIGGLAIISASIVVVIITTVGFALFTTPFVRCVLNQKGHGEGPTRNNSYPDDLRAALVPRHGDPIYHRSHSDESLPPDMLRGASQDVVADLPHHGHGGGGPPKRPSHKTQLQRIWKRLDKDVLQQIFGGRSASYEVEQEQPFTPVGALWLAPGPGEQGDLARWGLQHSLQVATRADVEGPALPGTGHPPPVGAAGGPP